MKFLLGFLLVSLTSMSSFANVVCGTPAANTDDFSLVQDWINQNCDTSKPMIEPPTPIPGQCTDNACIYNVCCQGLN